MKNMNKVELAADFRYQAEQVVLIFRERLKDLEAHKRQITFQKGDIISKQGTFAFLR